MSTLYRHSTVYLHRRIISMVCGLCVSVCADMWSSSLSSFYMSYNMVVVVSTCTVYIAHARSHTYIHTLTHIVSKMINCFSWAKTCKIPYHSYPRSVRRIQNCFSTYLDIARENACHCSTRPFSCRHTQKWTFFFRML